MRILTAAIVLASVATANADVLVGRQNVDGNFPPPTYDIEFDVRRNAAGEPTVADMIIRLGMENYSGIQLPVIGTITSDTDYNLTISDLRKADDPNTPRSVQVTPGQIIFDEGWSRDTDNHSTLTGLFGDSNLDGVFDSSDLVLAMAGGKYERNVWARWDQGDWDVDGYFSTGDLILAMQQSEYESPAVAVIPEPSAIVLLLIGLAIRLRHVR